MQGPAPSSLVRRAAPEADSDGVDDEPSSKRLKQALDDLAAEFMCPIALSLPVDPVTAEDGHVYERSAIEQWFSLGKQSSPVSNKAMGRKLMGAPQVRSALEQLVRTGAVRGDKADQWVQKIKDMDEVKRWREQAEAGNVDAQRALGTCFALGKMGLPVDQEKAKFYLMQAALQCDPQAIFTMTGFSTNIIEKVHWMTRAAEVGVELACWELGSWIKEGKNGLPKDDALAAVWFRKMRACTTVPCVDNERAMAEKFLSALEAGRGAAEPLGPAPSPSQRR